MSSTSADPHPPAPPLQDAGRRLRGLDDQHTEKQTATSTSAPAERPAGFYAAHLLPAGRSLHGSRVHLFLLHRGLENLLVLRGTGHFITERAEQGRAGQGGGEGWRRRLRQDGGGNNSEEAELVSRGRHPISREVLEERKRVLRPPGGGEEQQSTSYSRPAGQRGCEGAVHPKERVCVCVCVDGASEGCNS